MKLTGASGKLIVIGGAEDKENDCLILKEFVNLAGGGAARVVVITAATDKPEEVGAQMCLVFKRLGAKKVQAVDVSTREDSEREESLSAIRTATGVYFTGGDQLHITSLMGGSEMQRLLYRRFCEGLVIAGTSAGAAMMSDSMIIKGEGKCNPRLSAIEMGPGMDLIAGSIIDTHFSQRGRHGRLLSAVAHYPQMLAIGIDEDTAMIVDKTKFRVLGSGGVTIMDGSSMTYTNTPYIRRDEGLTLTDVKIHVLSENYFFDLEKRCLITEQSKKSVKAAQRDEQGAKKRK